jgi:hypothetical protein
MGRTDRIYNLGNIGMSLDFRFTTSRFLAEPSGVRWVNIKLMERGRRTLVNVDKAAFGGVYER